MLAPIQLQDSRFTEINIVLNREHNHEEPSPLGFTVESTVFMSDDDDLDPGIYEGMVRLLVTNRENVKNYPLVLTIESEGVFKLYIDNQDFTQEKIQDILKVNGSSVLYGQTRELFTLLSSRACSTPMLLPNLLPKTAFGSDSDKLEKQNDT